MKVVHLFNPERGSRYPLMINHGLLAHPEVGPDNLSTNGDVMSLGTTHHKGIDAASIQSAMEDADLIFRPNQDHLALEPLERLFTPELWHKTIYYDFRDHRGIDEKPHRLCRLYVKRTWPNSGLTNKIYPIPYSALPEYMFPTPPNPLDVDRYQFDALYLHHIDLLKGGNPNEASRRAVLQALHQHSDLVTIGQTTRTGRRDIFEPADRYPYESSYERAPPDSNPFVEYLWMLRRAKVIICILPDHYGGDNRIWEALASGNLVFAQREASDFDEGLIADKHYIPIEATSKPEVLLDLIKYWISDKFQIRAIREMIGRRARNRILSYNMPMNRIEEIFSVLRMFPGQKG